MKKDEGYHSECHQKHKTAAFGFFSVINVSVQCWLSLNWSGSSVSEDDGSQQKGPPGVLLQTGRLPLEEELHSTAA